MRALTATVSVTPALRPSRPAECEVFELSSVENNQWNCFVRNSTDGSIFHTTAWMGAVQAAFGHRDASLLAKRGTEIVGVLPLGEVRSLLGGKMLVSVPYGIYGGLLTNDPGAKETLLTATAELAVERHARCVELRSPRAAWPRVPVVDRYVTYRKRLPDRSVDCLGALPRKARAAARAAREKYRLSVTVDDTHLESVWRLYCRTMRRLRSLNYPLRFFRELVSRTPGQHAVSLVSHGGRPIGGLVTFDFHGVAMPYFVGVDERFRKFNVYNYLYLAAMEHAVDMGCHTFDFGRSRRDNVGSCTFKKNQGFEPEPLEYQCYAPPGRTAPNLTPSNSRFAVARYLWPALPPSITRPLGSWLTRQIPG